MQLNFICDASWKHLSISQDRFPLSNRWANFIETVKNISFPLN